MIEFLKSDAPGAEMVAKERWVKQEVERKKYRPKDVVTRLREAGFKSIRISPEHVNMWKAEDAKNPTKGYGTDVQGVWYWYERWIDRCLAICEAAGNQYR